MERLIAFVGIAPQCSADIGIGILADEVAACIDRRRATVPARRRCRSTRGNSRRTRSRPVHASTMRRMALAVTLALSATRPDRARRQPQSTAATIAANANFISPLRAVACLAANRQAWQRFQRNRGAFQERLRRADAAGAHPPVLVRGLQPRRRCSLGRRRKQGKTGRARTGHARRAARRAPRASAASTSAITGAQRDRRLGQIVAVGVEKIDQRLGSRGTSPSGSGACTAAPARTRRTRRASQAARAD